MGKGRQRVVLVDDNDVIADLPTALAAILAKLIAAPATETTLASILAAEGGLRTDVIYNTAAVGLTPKFAKIAAALNGDNTIVAAVVAKKIRVLACQLIGSAAVNAKFQSDAGGTDLTGLAYIATAGGGLVLPFNPLGWFETVAGKLLNLNLSGAIAVGGSIVYIEV